MATPDTAHLTAAPLTTRDAATYLGMAQATLEAWRCRGTGPRFVKLGTRAVRYLRADLDKFLAGGAVSPASPSTN